VRSLRFAFAFLTRLPLAPDRDPSGAELAGSLPYYPLVGLLVGALPLAVAAGLMRWTSAGAELSAALMLLAMVLLTGALHLDGLADAVDGLGGGTNKEDALRIMREGPLGPFGAVALALDLLLRWQASALLLSQGRLHLLLLAPVIARAALVVVILAFPYARKEGKAGSFFLGSKPRHLSAALLAALAVGLPLAPRAAPLLLAAAALAALAVGARVRRRIGGITGDILGLVNELVEVGLLVLLATIPSSTGWLAPWWSAGSRC
jgi:adenosylcobinamide-GDP ribazoletransferase